MCSFTWDSSGSGWLHVAPFTMRRILQWIKNEYGNPPVYITENGVSDRNGSLVDDHRVYYLQHYINNVLKGTLKAQSHPAPTSERRPYINACIKMKFALWYDFYTRRPTEIWRRHRFDDSASSLNAPLRSNQTGRANVKRRRRYKETQVSYMRRFGLNAMIIGLHNVLTPARHL